jgi:hypothetical protein
MSDARPDVIFLRKEFSFKVLLLFHETPHARSIPGTGPSENDTWEGLVGIKVNGSMTSSRLWGKVYRSKEIVIPLGLQIVGWIYRSPPTQPRRRKVWFRCRGWPWKAFASDEDRELDEAVLIHQLKVDSAALSGLTLKALVEKVKDPTTHQEASDAWKGLMKRYFAELQAREGTNVTPSDNSSLSRGPTTCPTCGISETGYQNAGTQTEQNSVWPYGLPAPFVDPGSDPATLQPDSGVDMWTDEQLKKFMDDFDSSSQSAGQ